jgi:hypothetical protein
MAIGRQADHGSAGRSPPVVQNGLAASEDVLPNNSAAIGFDLCDEAGADGARGLCLLSTDDRSELRLQATRYQPRLNIAPPQLEEKELPA